LHRNGKVFAGMIGAAAGAGATVLLGVFYFHTPVAPKAFPTATESAQTYSTPRAASDQSGSEGRLKVPATPKSSRNTSRDANLGCDETVERVADLDAEVRRLSRQVERLELEKKMEQGEPITFPADLNSRYVQPHLGAAFDRAFAEVGIDTAETFVDCDEYPCIVCALARDDEAAFNINKRSSEFKSVAKARSLSDYAGASKNHLVFTGAERAGNDEVHSTMGCWAVNPEPTDPTQERAIQNRVFHRANQIRLGAFP